MGILAILCAKDGRCQNAQQSDVSHFFIENLERRIF